MGCSFAAFSGCSLRDGGDTETSGPPGNTASSPIEGHTPASVEDRFSDRFDTILDVTEAGADPTGSEPVDDVLRRLVGDDTLLVFPEGTYRLGRLTVEGVSNFGLVGTDATLRLNERGRTIYLECRRVSDLLVQGFGIDNTAENTAAWVDLKCTGGHNVIRDYAVEGFVDVSERANGFTIMAEGGDTSVELDRVDLRHGARNGTATFVFPRRGFMDPSREAGSITFRNCVMKGWGKEGLYASAHEGPLRVLGGEYANNGIDQVRIGGGGGSTRAVVRGVTVRVDEIPSYMPERYRILRGIWLKEGDRALIENCEVTLANLSRNETPAAILVKDQFGRATIRNCTITTEDVSRPAVLVQDPVDSYDPPSMPSLERLPDEWGVTVENVTIEGHSTDSESIRIEGRNGCTVRGVTVDTTGRGADGLGLHGVGGCTLEGGSVTTQRYPVRIRFAGRDDCVLDVAGVSLEGRELETDGEPLAPEDGTRYCVGSGALSDGDEPSGNSLVLTASDEGATRETTETPAVEYQLRGRWVAG